MLQSDIQMHFKFDQNHLLLWTFLALQILVLIAYLNFSASWNNGAHKKLWESKNSISFLDQSNQTLFNKLGLSKYKLYYHSDVNEEIYLKTEKIEKFFITVNDTVCYQMGTDVEYMKRKSKFYNKVEKCECMPGYHGNDCSFPEVIWRAFIAFRQEAIIQKRSKTRRIIHMFVITHPAQIPLAAIKINELFSIVDLFIVAESNHTQNGESKPFYFKLRLDKGLCQGKQHKILFTPIYHSVREKKSVSKISWEKSRKIIKNLKDDDFFIQLDSLEIPNSKALLFFKLFDGFTLPVQFRLKWNVYGYFYQHPNKAKKVTAGSTVIMLENLYDNDPNLIQSQVWFVVGDLNHYGGWFCELCYNINEIPNFIQSTIEQQNQKNYPNNDLIDEKYLEQIIGDGIYIDGKTQLINNYEGKDNYYAPEYVVQHYWKYSNLMINLYNKADYI